LSEKYNKIFNKSIIPGIQSVFIGTYGNENGRRFYAQSGERLLTLMEGADDRGSAAIRRHMVKNILPVVSCYQVLQENGIPKDETCDLVVGEMHTTVKINAEIWRHFSNIPRLYPLFRRLCRRVMEKDYPDVGWNVHWVRDNPEGIAFDCRACVYMDVTVQLGCPELCRCFCQNDDIMYSVLSPKVRFVRTQTQAAGGDRCDFCFLNGKVNKRG